MSSAPIVCDRPDRGVSRRAVDIDELISRLKGEERRIIVGALWRCGTISSAARSLGAGPDVLRKRAKALNIEHVFGPVKMLWKAANRKRTTDTKKTGLTKLAVPPTRMPRLKDFVPIKCLCCGQPVNVPALDIVIDYYRVPKCEQRVLRVVWNGKGHPVQTERIFTAMYADDPDGGPSPDAMYRALKALLHNLRVRLAGSGITIDNVGYRQGYRLVIGQG